jgi:hypothetical protein
MKGELGLDRFEGRSYRGWHHHVSIVLASHSFVVSDRAQGYPAQGPKGSKRRPARHRGLSGTASSHCSDSAPLATQASSLTDYGYLGICKSGFCAMRCYFARLLHLRLLLGIAHCVFPTMPES